MCVMENKVVHNTAVGTINLSDDAISSIVAIAVAELPGISGFSRGFYNKIKNKIISDKTRGVRIEVADDRKVTIGIGVYVNYGIRIADTVLELQRHVKEAVEKMAEVEVVAVNVDIDGVRFKKD